MAPRCALLVLGLQNEFLDPQSGRCLMLNPSFVDNIKSFIPHFRAHGGDVIWVRSEYKKPRDFIDPRNDETVLIISDDSDDSDSEAERNNNNNNNSSSANNNANNNSNADAKPRLTKKGSRPPLRTDAFLAVESDYPPCAPGTGASEFTDAVKGAVVGPPDRVMVKTWFSAFKETPLLQTLRGRFISELYICGVITNVCVLATAADAAKHGLNVYVMPDCLGYRSRIAHVQSLKVMVDDYGAEEVMSGVLVKGWEKHAMKASLKAEGSESKGSQLGAMTLSKEELVKMVTGIKLGEVMNSAGEPVGKFGGMEEGEEKETGMIPKVGESEESALVDNITAPAIAVDSATQPTEDGLDDVLKKAEADRKARREEKAEVQRRVQAENDAAKRVSEEKKAEETTDEGREGKEKKAISHRKKKSQAGKDEKANRPKEGARNVATPTTKFDSKSPVMGEGDVLGEGDSKLVTNILPRFLAKMAFDKLKTEVAWRTMYHRGGEVPRMVAVEGEIGEDGSFPIYRHPADESPPLLQFSPTVNLVREYVQKELKHPVNHVLIQHYRGGNDYISEHSDKTIDIVRGSFIVNVSLGAQRTMILRTKKDAALDKAPSTTPTQDDAGPTRTVQRIPLPHNSMFVLGLESNRRWLHGIRQDRREAFLKTPEELANNGERISLTFRHIGTFLSSDESHIYGQGAVSKSASSPRPVINGPHPDTERLIQAFGSENHQSEFDWDASYGAGSDVLHFVPQRPKLFFAPDDVHSNRVRICLLEKGIEFNPHELHTNEVNSPSFRALNPRGTAPVLVDVDREKTTVCESLAILQYLEMSYPSTDPEKFLLPHPVDERAAFALVLQRMQESERLASILEYATAEEKRAELEIWNAYVARTGKYITGNEISLADIAVWPVVEKFVRRGGAEVVREFEALEIWRTSFEGRESTAWLLEGKRAEEMRVRDEETEQLLGRMAKLEVGSDCEGK